jgi:hypothetical protein
MSKKKFRAALDRAKPDLIKHFKTDAHPLSAKHYASDMDERIIRSFISRGFYNSQADVISAALRALLEKQMELDSVRLNGKSEVSDDMVALQLAAKGK